MQTILEKVLKLKLMYELGMIAKLEEHEVNPGLPLGDRLNYLYFTLPVAINFQRSSPAMWQAALKTYLDPDTHYLFYPEKVVNSSREKIQGDLLKYKLALQKNKHVDIWIRISKTLYEDFDSDPRNLFKATQRCVTRAKNLLQTKRKAHFPYLSGEKMANYWLYILANFTDIQLRNKHKISIIPDTHVMQCSIKLGLIENEINRKKLAKLWEDLLYGSGITPMEIHPVLWNWSRAKFKPDI